MAKSRMLSLGTPETVLLLMEGVTAGDLVSPTAEGGVSLGRHHCKEQGEGLEG